MASQKIQRIQSLNKKKKNTYIIQIKVDSWEEIITLKANTKKKLKHLHHLIGQILTNTIFSLFLYLILTKYPELNFLNLIQKYL